MQCGAEDRLPALKAAFEAKLRDDTEFADDPDARFARLYAHAGPGRPYFPCYPITREFD